MFAARRALAAIAALPVMQGTAFAQSGDSVGSRLQSIIESSLGPLIFVVCTVCFVGGLALLAKGLLGLKDATNNREGYATPLVTLVAATLLVALPQAAGVGMTSLIGDGGGGVSVSDINAVKVDLDGQASAGGGSFASYASLAQVGSPTNCFESSETVTCIANNLATNFVPVGIITIFVFIFLAGLWIAGNGLMQLTRNSGQGMPEGWWTKMAAAVLLMASPTIFMSISETLLGSSELISSSGLDTGSSLLTYSIGGSNKLKQYEDLIGYLFVILAFFGVAAFAKGLFVIKAAGDGRGGQGATFGHGITYAAAGILLANAKISTCTILTTAGLQELNAFGFCQ